MSGARFFSRTRALALALAFAAPVAVAQISNAEYAARRDSLAARIPDGAILVIGAPEPTEDFLSFWQSPSFLYLTGVREPEAALLMTRQGGRTVSTLFVQPLNPAAETWTGRRTGVGGALQRWGIAGRAASELESVLDSLARAGVPINAIGEMGDDDDDVQTRDAQIVQAIARRVPTAKVTDRNAEVTRLRGRKSAAELEAIRHAVAITVLAHREAALAAEPGMNEFELQALIEYTFRRNGADRTSFSTIVGSGPNSTILHYNTNDRFMNAGEVVVMDIGASWRGYAADVTRTIPVTGKFSPEQRAIYQIVRDAQAAGERNVKIGGSFGTASDSAARVLAEGLARLGLIESPTATYDCERGQCPQLRMYYMHGLGHGIGLEVHDPDQMYWGPIGVGSAFSIEPGIYVRANVLETLSDTPRNRALIAKLRPAVTRYANIGVRIEDDYIVTESGVEWISRAPREVAEVEALMAEPWSGPPKRDPAMVEKYRAVK